jgi:ABC-type Fe3+-hydroxamate transport system substrate-binding protein
MNDLTLYDCDELIKLVEAQAEKNEGELSESDWQLLVDAQTRSIEKLGKLVNYISLLDRFCDTADTEIDRIRQRKQMAKNRLESIKKYLIPYVQEKGRVTIGTYQLSIRNSEGVVLADGFNNPQYCNTITTINPDKQKIKESIKSGIEVQGAVLEKRISLQVK